ncbi:hypothetical protein D3C83_285830 [compost metagenome]
MLPTLVPQTASAARSAASPRATIATHVERANMLGPQTRAFVTPGTARRRSIASAPKRAWATRSG